MASEVELEALNSINTSKLKNIKSHLALLIWEHTCPLGSNKPIQNKKVRLLFYYKHCIKLCAV